MKKFLCAAIFTLFFCLASFAQDVIVLRNADEIQAKVLVVGIHDITYKKWDNQDGPSYQIAKNDVFFIKYANGTKEVFNQQPANPDVSASSDATVASRKMSPYFNAYVEGGCIFTADEAGPMLNATLGFHLRKDLFIGVQTGIDAFFGAPASGTAGFDVGSYLLMLDFRGYLPTKKTLDAYVECALGAAFLTRFGHGFYYDGRYYDFPTMATFRMQVGLGLEYRRATVSAGYSLFHLVQKVDLHCGYVKVGVRLGKLK
ncbi:MAG: hypothetical protein J5799_03650 [Bacteroidales bacterium]|nr:hypothetical protein [Bacteroidales bacterium]